jgi:hypothetical protein
LLLIFNVEVELTEAYNSTRSLEKDLKQLVSISEILVDKQHEYESKLEIVVHERNDHAADIAYLQEMYDQVIY